MGKAKWYPGECLETFLSHNSHTLHQLRANSYKPASDMPLLATGEAATWTEALCLSFGPWLMVPGPLLHRGLSTSLFPEVHPASTGCLVQVPSPSLQVTRPFLSQHCQELSGGRATPKG